MATSQRIETIFTAQDRASAVMRQIGSSADKLQGTFERIQAPLLRAQTLWASLAGGAIISGLTALTKAIDDLDEAAQGLGTTAVDLAAFRQAAAESGVGAEKFDTALARLNVNISEAAAGSPKAAAAFKAFGSATLDAAVKSGNTGQVLRELADEFSKLQDGPAKAALAVDLFGKGAQTLVPLLNGGAEALERFTGLTEKTVLEARKLSAEFDALGQTWERFKYQIGTLVIPVVNDLVAVFRQLDFGKIREQFNSFPLGNFGAAFREYTRQIDEGAKKQAQLREALKLGEGAYSNEGRAALGSAQAVRDKAAADEKAASAVSKKARATNESSNAYAKEFADFARIRQNRERIQKEIEAEDAAAAQRRVDRVEQLTGRSKAAEQAADLKLLDEALAQGRVSIIEYDLGMSELFGRGNDIEDGMKRQTELAEQLGLQLSSSLGDLITSGGQASDVFKALGQDILKIVTQLLILKPLAEEISKIFKGGFGTAGGSSGGSSMFASLITGLAGIFGGGAGAAVAGAATGTSMHQSWVGAGGSAAPPVTVYIDGATDRALITSYVEQGVKAGIAASVDSTRRGGSGVIG